MTSTFDAEAHTRPRVGAGNEEKTWCCGGQVAWSRELARCRCKAFVITCWWWGRRRPFGGSSHATARARVPLSLSPSLSAA